jgi:hypothetical protein
MKKLSHAANRLLGTALVDASFRKRLLGPERDQLVSASGLTDAERRAALSSRARDLRRLAQDLSNATDSQHG